MDSLNKNFSWFTDASPAFAKELSGTFVTSLEGVPCELELKVIYKSLQGSLKLDAQVFEIRGVVSSQMKTAYGVLLEPVSNTPIALLRITPKAWGVVLELDMPDFDVVTLYEPRAFQFRRASTLST
jgi:hypothetical protein